MGATRRAAASRWLLMMLCDPGTARFKSVYMQAWVRESMIKNNPDKSRRRGGWKVKPRQYIRWRPLDEDIMCRKDYWEGASTAGPGRTSRAWERGMVFELLLFDFFWF